MNNLGELNSTGITIVLITHDMNIARQALHYVTIRDGMIAEQGVN